MTDQTSPDWAGLNPDLVRLIANKIKKFDNMSYFFNFSAVCKAWQATCLARPSPWLFSHPCNSTEIFQFFSVLSSKTHTVASSQAYVYRLPNIEPSQGPCDSANDAMLLVLNPRSWTKRFPSVRLFYPIPGCNLVINNNHAIWYSRLEKGVAYKYLSFRPRGKKVPFSFRVPLATRAVAYTSHKFVVLTRNSKKVMVIDEPTGAVLSKIFQLPARDIQSFISLGDGSLLAVRHNFAGRKPVAKYWFEIYRLGNNLENSHWTKLSEIGDHMLLLDEYNGFSLKASDLHGFRGNCIYFITRILAGHEIKFGLYMYDLKENKTEKMAWPAGFGKAAKYVNWFVPALY